MTTLRGFVRCPACQKLHTLTPSVFGRVGHIDCPCGHGFDAIRPAPPARGEHGVVVALDELSSTNTEETST